MSYAIYIGRDHTAEGVPYLAGYGDEPSSHWLEIVPARDHPAGTTVAVGVTAGADLPGRMSQIPQVARTARYCRVSYSYYKGTPAPLTNGGLNEHGVAVRDVWSTSRQDLIAMTPPDQSGPNYSDLARLVLERARSAREGVDLIGRQIAEHGHTTYGGNSHLIADPDEAWVVIQFAGGQGLWVAERLGAGSIRVSRPGYVGRIPEGGDGGTDFLHSENFFRFAIDRGWHRPDGSGQFDVNAVYGDGRFRWPGVATIEDELAGKAAHPGRIAFTDVVAALRDPRFTGDTAGYGQIVPLVHPRFADLRVLWHAQVGPVAAPLTPVFLGAAEVPPEYRQHRYLTDGEAARFIDLRKPDMLSIVPQGIEATRSATYTFKRLQHLALQNADPFLPEVQAVWDAMEQRLAGTAQHVATATGHTLAAGDTVAARDLLTWFTCSALTEALDTAEALAQALDIRTRALFGISDRREPRGPEQLW